MSKYINASEAEMIIEDTADNLYGEKYDFSAHIVRELQDKIRNMPSADVVKVVRCKDCKHFVETGGTRGICCLFQGMTNPRNDDFCSEGERKESKVKRCFDIPKDVAERLLEDTERKEADG